MRVEIIHGAKFFAIGKPIRQESLDPVPAYAFIKGLPEALRYP
jgi:hypothetical protein